MSKAFEQVGSTAKLKKDLERSGRGPFTFIGDEGLLVRFLQDPDDWYKYYSYFDKKAKATVVVDEDFEPLDDDTRVTKRYLANAIDIDNDKVVALCLPVSLVTAALVPFLERRGTLTDRDYFLDRRGKGFDTTYTAMDEGDTKRRLSKYKLLDLRAILTKAQEAGEAGEAGEVDEDDDAEEEPPRRRRRAASTSSEESTTRSTKARVKSNPTTTTRRRVRR